MVCKQDVLLWFKDLEGYKRIDILYELLNMCLPFELRFLGSCIEEFGKHTYQALRGPALYANDLDRLPKDLSNSEGLFDESVRHRVLISLSLLSSRNYSVANWLYKSVLRTDCLEESKVKGNLIDDNILSELLLLFLMALYHPAFTFEQRLYFSKTFTQLLEFKENKSRISPKPSIYGYPPGFGFPTVKTMNNSEVSIPPLKTAATISSSHESHLHLPQPSMVQPAQELQWNIPGFLCGAPEVPPPFPLPTLSSLVNESPSPNHSRSTSPQRTMITLQSTPRMPVRCTRATDFLSTQVSADLMSTNNTMFLQSTENVKMPVEDSNNVADDKSFDGSWLPMKDVKQHNGFNLGLSSVNSASQPFVVDQFQKLSLDGPNLLHHSNSSSNSSLNQTPPETPATSYTSSHCLNPGDKPHVNGIPTYVTPGSTTSTLSLCDATTSPSPLFNSVPYTTFPTFTAIPTRSIFPYTQSYRAPFPHFSTNDNSFSPYSLSCLSIIYPNPQFSQRTPNCYNCGALGHTGQDCSGQSIEDITQKTGYTIEYLATTPPETDK